MSTPLGDSRLNENSKWTPEEDAVLIEAVTACESFGHTVCPVGYSPEFDLAGPRRCWNTIAQSLAGRTNKSCRKRWIHSLDPSLRKGMFASIISVAGGVLKQLSLGRWTNAEDIQLIQAVKQYGRQWHKVADLLPGRTDDQCAKRWREKLDPSIRKRFTRRIMSLNLMLPPQVVILGQTLRILS